MNYKVGVIGAGAIVESGHLPALLSLEGVSVNWIFDLNDKRTDLLSKMYGVNAIKKDQLHNAVSDVDVCLLTVPYGVRKEYIQILAEQNKGLYVEKPFALTTNEHREYCKLFPANKLAIGYQRRCYKIIPLLSSIISSGAFGSLQKIIFRQGYFTLKGGKGYLSDAKLSGGGVIIESAVHTLDQILLMTAASEVKLVQLSSFEKKGIDYDSLFLSKLQTSTGDVEVECEISTLRNLDNGLTLEFDNAIIKTDVEPNPVLKIYNKHGVQINAEVSILNSYNGAAAAENVTQAFVIFWKQFFDGLENNTANITSAVNSILTTSWVEQIYNKIMQQ
jgi:predicted dehydrogenase